MNCQKCGVQNADDASFCSKCGNNIGKLKSIPIGKTTVEHPKSILVPVLRWIVGIWFGLYGIGVIFFEGSFVEGIVFIILSIAILPINKLKPSKSNSMSENKREYKNIDVRELEKNVSKFIDQKIRISGTVSWIEERDGNTHLIINAAVPWRKYGYTTLGHHKIYIECLGSIPILASQYVVFFGVVKGKHEIQYTSTGAKNEVPFIFATAISIKKNSAIF